MENGFFIRRCILLFAQPYSIVDENTLEKNEGISLRYYPSDVLSPVKNDNSSIGMKPGKASLPIELLHKLQIAPAIYDLTFFPSIDSNGKMIMKLQDINFCSSFEV